jgi:hypothetical protein
LEKERVERRVKKWRGEGKEGKRMLNEKTE